MFSPRGSSYERRKRGWPKPSIKQLEQQAAGAHLVPPSLTGVHAGMGAMLGDDK